MLSTWWCWPLSRGWLSRIPPAPADSANRFARLPKPIGASKPMPGGWSKADRKSTRLNSSHSSISSAVFCLKKKHQRVVDAHLADFYVQLAHPKLFADIVAQCFF